MGLRVQREALRVLDAGHVTFLGQPDVPDAVGVQQRDAQGVATLLPVKRVEKLLDEPGGLLRTARLASAVGGQLAAGDAGPDVRVAGGRDLLRLQLGALGFSEVLHILGAPLEDAGGEAAHEEAVELVRVRGAARREAAHEVPHVQPDIQLGSVLKQVTQRPAAAVSVHVEQRGQVHAGRRVAGHDPDGHGGQTVALTGGQHAHQDLAELVAHVGGPRRRSCAVSCQLLYHLLGRIQLEHLAEDGGDGRLDLVQALDDVVAVYSLQPLVSRYFGHGGRVPDVRLHEKVAAGGVNEALTVSEIVDHALGPHLAVLLHQLVA